MPSSVISAASVPRISGARAPTARDNAARMRRSSAISAPSAKRRRLFRSTIACGSTNTVLPDPLVPWTTPRLRACGLSGST
jgi:hypothetical protein